MDKRAENALTIAATLGLEPDEALALLRKSIEVLNPKNSRAGIVPERTFALLSRTFDDVRFLEAPTGCANLVICWGASASNVAALVVTSKGLELQIGPSLNGEINASAFGVGQQTIGACFVAGAAIRMLLPAISDNVEWPMTIDLEPFAVPSLDGVNSTDIGHTYLIGAGAIGNGFVWSLEHDRLTGDLTILDKDVIKEGNLQRNILNSEGDLNEFKVDVLARYLKTSQPYLRVDPKPERTETAFKASGNALRIPRLISAVDSPRARRALQAWLPREVFDASTSGIQEVIFHHNAHPLNYACLECVYPFGKDERAHERHVAEALGVPIDALAEGIISDQRAEMITAKYPDYHMDHIVGEAYDSLFKKLCGAGQLPVSEGERVLAPLAFISVLAGAILAVELQRRLSSDTAPNFNFWRLSPWRPPRVTLQRRLSKNEVCRFCSDPINANAMKDLWG